MTIVFEQAADGPQIHALVVGVDHYPHCGRRTRQQGLYESVARDISPLGCAQPSAQAVASWLVERGDGGHPPVGSVELLVSAGVPVEFDGGDGPVEVEAAAFANTRAAFLRWKQRCDRREDNIALMYFCGHGLRLGGQDVLLLEDVGDPEQSFFRNAVDFSATLQAMMACKARVQC